MSMRLLAPWGEDDDDLELFKLIELPVLNRPRYVTPSRIPSSPIFKSSPSSSSFIVRLSLQEERNDGGFSVVFLFSIDVSDDES